MKRFSATVLAAALAWLPSTGVSEPPGRILSLDLCSDWMLARHANPDQVLALSPFVREYPVDWVDGRWPSHDGTLERILQLDPDLIVVGEYNALQLRRRLQALGRRVEVLSLPTSLDEIRGYQERFLDLLGRPPEQRPAAIPADTAAIGRQRLLLLGANGIGTGRNTFEHGIIERAGWRNYLQDEGYITLDLEQLVADPPDAILWAAPRSKALANRFARHPALQQLVPAGRWLSTDYWRWQCPGSWTWELIGQLQQWRD